MNMRTVGVKVTPQIYDQIKSASTTEHISVSAYLRRLIERRFTKDNLGKPEDNVALSALTAQIREKDDQIRELHQLLGMSQKNQAEMTLQLNRANRQIEEMRKRRWWQLWGRR